MAATATMYPMRPTGSAALTASRPSAAKKRTSRMKRHRVANCSDTAGQATLHALEARLNSIRIAEAKPGDDFRPRPRPVRPAGAPMKQVAHPARPHFVKPLALAHGKQQAQAHPSLFGGMRVPHRPSVAPAAQQQQPRGAAPLTPLRPARPSSASARRPGILKKRQRRTQSATTRREMGAAALTGDYLPAGMIVSLPPLPALPSMTASGPMMGHSSRYSQHMHMDIDEDHHMAEASAAVSEVDTDDELGLTELLEQEALDRDEEGSIGESAASFVSSPGSSSSSSTADAASAFVAAPMHARSHPQQQQQQQQAARPHVAVDNHAFVHDMLVSLDDSLEENGFRAAMAAFAHDAAAAASSGAGMRGTATGASAPLMSPLNDTPTLLQGALSPSSWAAPAGEERDTGAALSTGLGAIPSLGSVSNLLADMGTAAGFAFMD